MLASSASVIVHVAIDLSKCTIVLQCDDRTQLASKVNSPLFTKPAYDLMKRKLQPKDQDLWGSLGANWLITMYVRSLTKSGINYSSDQD